MLAEHLDKLNENGLNIDHAISGGTVVTKQNVVKSLDIIGQTNKSKILNNKQGNQNMVMIIILWLPLGYKYAHKIHVNSYQTHAMSMWSVMNTNDEQA